MWKDVKASRREGKETSLHLPHPPEMFWKYNPAAGPMALVEVRQAEMPRGQQTPVLTLVLWPLCPSIHMYVKAIAVREAAITKSIPEMTLIKQNWTSLPIRIHTCKVKSRESVHLYAFICPCGNVSESKLNVGDSKQNSTNFHSGEHLALRTFYRITSKNV